MTSTDSEILLETPAPSQTNSTQQITEPIPQSEPQQNPQRRTPLPKKKLVVVFTMLFCDVLALTGIAPYINAMTADLLGLDEGKDQTKVGYYAGIIASSYYIAQLFCR
jgi:hypothetical protein